MSMCATLTFNGHEKFLFHRDRRRYSGRTIFPFPFFAISRNSFGVSYKVTKYNRTRFLTRGKGDAALLFV